MRYLKWLCCFYLIGTCLFCEGFVFPPAFEKVGEEIDAPSSNPYLLRLTGGYTFGKFMGFKKNYAEIDLFFAPATIGRWQPFVDIRGYEIDHHRTAVSGGVGMRLWEASTLRAIGGNLYYDYQETSFEEFQRLGIGVESLGKNWDFRLNGYLLVNGSVKKECPHFYYFKGGFKETCETRHYAFSGADAEIGFPLSICTEDFSLYNAIGPYYYRSHHHEFFGGYFRMQLNWLDNVTVEARISYDKRFHTECGGRILINFPLYDLVYLWGYQTSGCQQRLKQPVIRNPMIATEKCCSYKQNW